MISIYLLLDWNHQGTLFVCSASHSGGCMAVMFFVVQGYRQTGYQIAGRSYTDRSEQNVLQNELFTENGDKLDG